MQQSPASHSPAQKHLFPEFLLSIVALVAVCAGVYTGRISTMQDVWFVALLLLIILVFHAMLYILRIMLFWATKDWEMYSPEYWKNWEKHSKEKK